MTVPSMAEWGSLVLDRARRHILARPTLPLVALILLASVLLLGMMIHPTESPGRIRQGSLQALATEGTGIDYYQFWIVGRARERLRPSNIYSTADRRRMAELGQELAKSGPQLSTRLAESVEFRAGTVETFSTPFLYAVIGALASGQYDRDFDRFLDLGLACLLLSVIGLGWLLRFSIIDSLLFATVVVLWSEPLASDLRVGNVNLLELAGLTLYLLTRSWAEVALADLLGGFALGLLVAFKPTLAVIPLLLATAWVIDRRWAVLRRHGIGAAMAVGVALVTGSVFLGSGSAWLDWARALPELEKVSNLSVEIGNCSLSQVILEATGGQAGGGPVVSLILLVLVLGVGGATLLRSRAVVPGSARDRRYWFERDFVVTAVGGVAAVLTLRLVWLHYYVLVLPLLLWVLRPGAWVQPLAIPGRGPGLRLATSGPILALVAMVMLLGGPFLCLTELGATTSTLLYLIGALALLLQGLAGLWMPPSVQPPGDPPA